MQEEVYFGNRILWKKKGSDGGNEKEDQEDFPNPELKEEDSADGAEASMPCEFDCLLDFLLFGGVRMHHTQAHNFFDLVFNLDAFFGHFAKFCGDFAALVS